MPGPKSKQTRKTSGSPRHRELVARVAGLTGAQRVLLLLEGDDGLTVADARLPRGEDAAKLRAAITPWLEEMRQTRRP
ncbi:MAG: hypothetical protein ABI520_16865, partial [Caldimonas sp.]